MTSSSTIIVTSTEAPGNYRIQAGGGQKAVDLGFSVNLPPTTWPAWSRRAPEDLKAIFGDTPFRLAHNREEIDRSISVGRVGPGIVSLPDRAVGDRAGLRAGAVQPLLSGLRHRRAAIAGGAARGAELES